MSKPKIWTLPALLDKIWSMTPISKKTVVETTELRTSGSLAGTGGRVAHRIVTAYDEDYKDRTYHLNKIGAPVAAALYERIKTMRAKVKFASPINPKAPPPLGKRFYDLATGGDVEEPEIGSHYAFSQNPVRAGYERFAGHVCEVDAIREYDDPPQVVVLNWTTFLGGSLWGLEEFSKDFTKLSRESGT